MIIGEFEPIVVVGTIFFDTDILIFDKAEHLTLAWLINHKIVLEMGHLLLFQIYHSDFF
jgi:hypothetical protein